MKRVAALAIVIVVVVVVISAFVLSGKKDFVEISEKRQDLLNSKSSMHLAESMGSDVEAPPNESVKRSFKEHFLGDFVLEETGDMAKSADAHWWVNSGAYLYSNGGVAKTIFGALEKGEKWQKRYYNYNSSETDRGIHPQNIFRLINKAKWRNIQQESYYRVSRYILSEAKERSASNGILLFNRYQDGDNLYYTGIRVDGYAVIKKKTGGKYFTMAYEPVYPGKYDRKKNPNLLPIGAWIGVRSEVTTELDGSVLIKVFLDRDRSGNWELVAEAIDDGKTYGGAAILDAGHAGIRTDFMDVEFDDYRIEEIGDGTEVD